MNLNDDTFSDPNFGQELADLNFDNLIGGPLGAVVSAQASSALETINFIEEIGLEMEEGEIKPVMTSFQYQKLATDTEGKYEMRSHNLDVPLLSIIPIPFLQFSDVWLDFNVNLNSVQERKSDITNTFTADGGLQWRKWDISGNFSTVRNKKSTGKVSRNYNMHIQLHAVQDDMPEGMERVLNILEQVATAEVKPYNAVRELVWSGSANDNHEFIPEDTGDATFSIKTLVAKSSGQGYSGARTFTNVSLVGAIGGDKSASATVVVDKEGNVTSITLTQYGLGHNVPGHGYTDGEVLEFAQSSPLMQFSGASMDVIEVKKSTDGKIDELKLVNATGPYGSGFVKTKYNDVSLVGGSGSGATGDFDVDPTTGELTVTLKNAGSGYKKGDILGVNQLNIGNFGGGGFTTEVSEVEDTPSDWFDTAFICTASGGSGSGLRVRVNLTGIDTSGVGTISVTTDDIIDSGRDYVLGEKVTLTNTNGPGRIEDVEITKVL